MLLRVAFLTFLTLMLFGGVTVNAQPDLPDASSRTPGSRPHEDSPSGLKEMLSKQKMERDKKEYQDMLDRGDEALKLAKQLEASYEQNGSFSQQDRLRLENLERTVTKIRKELGASDEDDSVSDPVAKDDDPKPTTMEEAFKFLQSNTVKLVDELKKSTRFSVSVVAIQTSNTVLKLVKFLRFRK